MRIIFNLVSILLILNSLCFGISCEEWFKNLNILLDSQCIIKCTSSLTGLGTSYCPKLCPNLCKSTFNKKFIFKISDLYPGLTESEKALASNDPVKTLKAYELSFKAESLCLKLYSKSKSNDESDACRHFIWAGLLYKEFGLEFGSQVLNAHEQDPKEPDNERSMDLANNRLGLICTEKLVNSNKFNDESLIDSFKEQLKLRNLIIINHGDLK